VDVVRWNVTPQGGFDEQQVERQTVDLSAFPDLIVIYLGMRVNA
jgi:hypothetical protein